MHKSRILFILKRREDYDVSSSYSKQGVSTGLWNSARLVVEMLNEQGIESKLVEVIDNNCIDREVTKYKPTDVIVEALWVVPEKFEVLTRLHPTVKWNIRLHSELPFLANEGIAMGWLTKYITYNNVTISANSPRMLEEVKFILRTSLGTTCQDIEEKVFYLPNYYMPPIGEHHNKIPLKDRDYINIGCFGAIRPLKNHLMQAVAALKAAEMLGKKLNFHINVGRTENQGEPVYKNLKELFDALTDKGHKLVEHTWMPHHEFLKILHDMDVGLQVSFTETFNIVSADLVASGIPIVISKEVTWAAPMHADPTNSNEIVSKIISVLRFKCINVWLHRYWLKRYSRNTIKAWKKVFG